MKKPSKKQAGVGGTVIFVLVLFLAAQQTAFNTGVTTTFANGDSMKPYSHPNDYIVCVPSLTGYDVGDPVIYEDDKYGSIHHRIISEAETGYYNENAYILKGDNNEERDKGIVYERQIQCKTLFVIPTHLIL